MQQYMNAIDNTAKAVEAAGHCIFAILLCIVAIAAIAIYGAGFLAVLYCAITGDAFGHIWGAIGVCAYAWFAASSWNDNRRMSCRS